MRKINFFLLFLLIIPSISAYETMQYADTDYTTFGVYSHNCTISAPLERTYINENMTVWTISRGYFIIKCKDPIDVYYFFKRGDNYGYGKIALK